MRCSGRSAGREHTSSMPPCWRWSRRRSTPSRCRARAPKPRYQPTDGAAPAPALRPASGAVFILLVTAFAAYAFIPSGLSAHLLGILQRAGIDSGTAVMIGALFGPSQVAARLCELIFARNLHPAVDRALRRHADRISLRDARAARHLDADRFRLRDHVRRRQWADHHSARRGAARAVRQRRLRPHHRPDRACRACSSRPLRRSWSRSSPNERRTRPRSAWLRPAPRSPSSASR